MVHTPASFRALREIIGYTRAELARALSVEERTVRYWESPNENSRQAPDGAWLWLETARRRQVERVGQALDIALAYIESAEPPEYIELPYYVSQEHYEQTRRDEPEFPEEDRATVANAANRELVALLADEGVEVRFTYPSSPRETTRGA